MEGTSGVQARSECFQLLGVSRTAQLRKFALNVSAHHSVFLDLESVLRKYQMYKQ